MQRVQLFLFPCLFFFSFLLAVFLPVHSFSIVSRCSDIMIGDNAGKGAVPVCSRCSHTLSLMLKLKLQYSGHLMRRADSFEKTLMLGKIEGRRGRARQRMRWLDGITDSMDEFVETLGSVGQRSLACYNPWDCKESDTTQRLNNNNK